MLPGFSFFLFFFFLWLLLQHMEVPGLGVKSELNLPFYTTATAMQDPSRVCDLYHSSWQCRILNPLNEARNQTCNVMVPSRICFRCTMMGTPRVEYSYKQLPSQSLEHFGIRYPENFSSFQEMRMLLDRANKEPRWGFSFLHYDQNSMVLE